jgi:hypothetical protein
LSTYKELLEGCCHTLRNFHFGNLQGQHYKLRAFAAILCAYRNGICSSAYQHRLHNPADATLGKQKRLYTLDWCPSFQLDLIVRM